jgi:hypothetical protein
VEATSTVTLVQKNKGRFQKEDYLSHSVGICGTINSFPMIPMTVLFTKQSKSRAKGIRNAVIYGISIIVIYVVLGFMVTWILVLMLLMPCLPMCGLISFSLLSGFLQLHFWEHLRLCYPL